MDAWSPDQYERFKRERDQPFFDLLALAGRCEGGRVVDLGCGTGALTALIPEATGAARTLGIDSSEAMLEKALPLEREGLAFVRADIAAFDERPWDLVFSNAALQWLPDHETLIARLAGLLAPGGRLAVQVPANFDQPAHVVAKELADEPRWRTSFAGRAHAPDVLSPTAYSRLLHRLGLGEQHVRLQVYAHLLPSREDVVEWVKGTLLNAWLPWLPEDDRPAFLQEYRDRLLPRLPDERPFLFPFQRILLTGRRSGSQGA